MLRACPTWVWVKPMDSRRILKALANSLISSRLTPSTKLPVDWLMVGWSVGEGAKGGPGYRHGGEGQAYQVSRSQAYHYSKLRQVGEGGW